MGISALLITLKRRWMTVALAIIVGGAVSLAVAIMIPKEYRSSAKVQVDALQENQLTGSFEPRIRVSEFLGQQAAIAGSRVVALQVLDTLLDEGILVYGEMEREWRNKTGGEELAGNDLRLWGADKLLENVEIKADALESTLAISFRSADASLSARGANAFANAYMDVVLSQRQRRAARNAENFSEETQSLERDIEIAQRELTAFRESSGIVALGEQRLEAAEVELASITLRLAEAQADLSEANSLLIQAHAAEAEQLLTLPLPEDAQSGRQAQSRLGGVLVQVQRLSERFGENYPDYQDALHETYALQDTILRAVEDRAEYAGRRVAALQASADKKKSEVIKLQDVKQYYDVLEKRVAANRLTYDVVAARSLEESLQSRIDFVEVFLLARAVPHSNPVTPPMAVIFLIGLLASAIMGASGAVAQELIDPRVHDAHIAEHLLGAPLLGSPTIRRRKKKRTKRHFGRAAA